MKTELATRLETFNAICTLDQIKEMEKYLTLRIDGLDDQDNYDKVYAALQIVKVPRIAIEKARVEEKKEALDYGRAVDAAATKIKELIEPIETHLKLERKRIDDLAEEIKQKELFKIEIEKCYDEAREADKQFDERVAEQERLEDQRIEQERIAAEQAAKQAEIDSKEREETIRQEERERVQQAIDDAEKEAKEKVRKAEEMAKLEKLRADERIKEETERLEREANEKAEREQRLERERISREHAEKLAQEKAEQKRIKEEKRKAELAPDIDKLKVYLSNLVNMPLPDIKDVSIVNPLNTFYGNLKRDCRRLLSDVEK